MYRCVCGNGATLGHISGCDNDAGCKACCKGKGGVGMVMMDNHISKTRGVPSAGSTNYGPRGHSMAQFQNAVGVVAAQGAPTANWSTRIDKLSCNALKSRMGILKNKLEKLKRKGSNTNWQNQLNDKISYMSGVINNNCSTSNFAGTQWQGDTAGGTGWQQTGVFSNWAGDSIAAPVIQPPLIVTQSSLGTKPDTAGISATHIALSMLSVGVLFFVIGYSFEKGKKA
jgi:hypothetical protein|tara:strand:- start:1584 stop:2264 length:681 start_codon:yes stop_codon:yes gene_type:complete